LQQKSNKGNFENSDGYWKMLSKEQNVQECDTTEDDSPQDAAHSNIAGFIIKNIKIIKP
jgi:hypothetical protein